jgi:hypothetical protein
MFRFYHDYRFEIIEPVGWDDVHVYKWAVYSGTIFSLAQGGLKVLASGQAISQQWAILAAQHAIDRIIMQKEALAAR